MEEKGIVSMLYLSRIPEVLLKSVDNTNFLFSSKVKKRWDPINKLVLNTSVGHDTMSPLPYPHLPLLFPFLVLSVLRIEVSQESSRSKCSGLGV